MPRPLSRRLDSSRVALIARFALKLLPELVHRALAPLAELVLPDWNNTHWVRVPGLLMI